VAGPGTRSLFATTAATKFYSSAPDSRRQTVLIARVVAVRVRGVGTGDGYIRGFLGRTLS